MAFQLNQKQIPETYALKGGTNAWKTAGYPMEGKGAVSAPPGAPPGPGTTDAAPKN